MRVIDTHVHDVPISRKVPGLRALVEPAPTPSRQSEAATLSDLIHDMDRSGVTTSLVVVHEETGEFFRLAAGHPGRLFGLAYYDSLTPRDGLEHVRALSEDHFGKILGVVTAPSCFGQDPRLRDFVPLYEYCIQRGLPVQFHLNADASPAGAARPMAFAVLAATYPQMKIVCLCPQDRRQDIPDLLHQFSNIFLAVGGLARREAGADEADWHLPKLCRVTGTRKIMFGSGWAGPDATYPQRIEAIRNLPWWQRANVCWRTALRVYGPQLRGNRKLDIGNRDLQDGKQAR